MFVYQEIARAVASRAGCLAKADNGYSPGRQHWLEMAWSHETRALDLVKEYLPAGSGFDSGTQLDLDKSTEDKLIFNTAFHHMDDNGSYCGWTAHVVTVTPSLAYDINVKVSGRDKRGIKNYIADAFNDSLERAAG